MKRFPILATACAALGLAALVHADGPTLKTTELGHGPTIVFVHAVGGSRMDWMPTARKLLARHRVVLVDLPGHGDSPLPDPFSIQAAAAALDGVLAQQNPDSTIVVAQQIGGTTALYALAAHPERARGLVLIDAPIKSPIAIDEQQKQQFFDFMDKNYAQFSQMAFAKLGRDSAQSAAIFAVVTQTPQATMTAYFREAMRLDGNAAVHALKVPLELILTDRVWKQGGWTGAAKALGWEDTTVVKPVHLSNAGFWAMKDQPDSLAALVDAFSAERVAAKK